MSNFVIHSTHELHQLKKALPTAYHPVRFFLIQLPGFLQAFYPFIFSNRHHRFFLFFIYFLNNKIIHLLL